MARTKTCRRCGAEKPATKFGRHGKNRDGLQSYCKVCCRAVVKESAARRPERVKEIRKNTKLKARYGIDISQFDALLELQGGKCAICHGDQPGGFWDVWMVDHDHSTGIVRGLLCYRCNLDLGTYERMLKAFGADSLTSYLASNPLSVI